MCLSFLKKLFAPKMVDNQNQPQVQSINIEQLQGYRLLHSLPDDIKTNISTNYESLDNLYWFVFHVTSKLHKAYREHNKEEKQKCEDIRYKVAKELESYGIEDGFDIYDEISGDRDEVWINVNIPPLTENQKALLASLGID